jgi:hypothetical protein
VYVSEKKGFIERALESQSLIPAIIQESAVPSIKFLAY